MKPELDIPLHPYYPLGVVVAEYVAPTLSTLAILTIFGLTCLGILTPTWFFVRSRVPRIAGIDAAATLWFVLCGFIHLGLEGYFALHFDDLASRPTILAQMWKEYSLSDSRYLTADAFVVCMESVTAFIWGPLSFVCAWFIVSGHPLRHPLQSMISIGQFYGVVLYYGTCMFEFAVAGTEYSRPESAYFWGYYVFLNAFWTVIPLYLIGQSTRATARAFAAVKTLETKRVAPGSKTE